MLPVPGQLPDWLPQVPEPSMDLAVPAAIAVVATVIGFSLLRELVAVVKARQATMTLRAQRQDALNAVDNLVNTVDDVIMFPEGSKERLGQVMVLLLNADTRPDLQRRLARASAIVDNLPYDEPAFQALDGSWALKDGQEIVARELADLEAAAAAHEAAVDSVTYSRWNLPLWILHNVYQLVVPTRWMDGKLPTDTSRIESLGVAPADTDGDATDYMVNVNDTTVEPIAEPDAATDPDLITTDSSRPANDAPSHESGEVAGSVDMEDLEWIESTKTDSSPDAN